MEAAPNKNLRIILHRTGSPNEKQGTFTGPAPKMIIKDGYISFDLQVTPNDNTATFQVDFPASPFTSDDTVNGAPIFSIDNSNPHKAVFAGLYHYTVTVTTQDGTYSISNCPELEINPNLP